MKVYEVTAKFKGEPWTIRVEADTPAGARQSAQMFFGTSKVGVPVEVEPDGAGPAEASAIRQPPGSMSGL